MNHRERFLGTFQFKDIDRVPNYEFGYWQETIDRWHTEGLPSSKRTSREVELCLGLEGLNSLEMLPVRSDGVRPIKPLWPPLPERVLKKEGDREIVADGMGGMYLRTVATTSIPHYIRYPLKNREDWQKIRPFFDPDTPGRFPIDWDEMAESYKERDYPLGIRIGSLYGWLRNLMGLQGISVAFYKDPDLIAEMMDALVHLKTKIIRRALSSVRVDYATWWEDMCYNRGPMVSVHHFEEFMVPRYKIVTDLLREYGVEINILDSDGNVTALLPGWLKAGINCIFPMEARCNDIRKLREIFGRRVLLMGGVNKMALTGGRKSIDEELKRLTPVLVDGGYIPTMDHFCPPDISYSMYRYYLEKKREWIVRPGVSKV